eukprot:gene30939-38789_t
MTVSMACGSLLGGVTTQWLFKIHSNRLHTLVAMALTEILFLAVLLATCAPATIASNVYQIGLSITGYLGRDQVQHYIS